MVPLTFHQQTSQLFHFFQNVQSILLVIFQTETFFLVNSQPLRKNLTNSQLIAGWEWPKSNSQLFFKFPNSIGTMLEV